MFSLVHHQAILDMTYFEENKLVDEDFPEDSSQKVKELITFLSEPEILVKENNMYPKVSFTLVTDGEAANSCSMDCCLESVFFLLDYVCVCFKLRLKEGLHFRPVSHLKYYIF